MKGTLNFDLPEESSEFKLAQNASSYLCVISDLDNWLRSCTKYETQIFGESVSCQSEIAGVVREKIHSLLEEYEVSL